MAASTQLLTDIQTCITNGPTALTQTAAINATGPIIDPVGSLYLIQTKLKETKVLLNALISVQDAGDGNKTTLQNIVASFV